MSKISEAISRIRGQVKAEVQDAFVTDRYIYSLIEKYAQVLMRRQDYANKLMKFNSVWKTLPYIELIDVDKVEAHCAGITSGCTIKRSKKKLPSMFEGYWGPLIRTVSSIDGSKELQATQPGTFTSMTKTTTFKYNKTLYFWWLDGYIYAPNIEWDALKCRDELKKVNGVAHFLEHMAFKGTTTRTSKQIAEAIENVGGDINAYTSTETTAYHVRLIADDLPVGIDILTDILQNSTFAEEELEIERGVILQEIGRTLDSPDSKLFDQFQETAFPDQPIGRSLLGPKDIIKNISRNEIKTFMESNYNPKKMIVSAAGKVNHDDFVERISKTCFNLPKGTSDNRIAANYIGGEYREEKDLEQIHFIASFEGTDLHHEDYYSLLVYNSLLGEGMSSNNELYTNSE
jgi:hypothetical protein